MSSSGEAPAAAAAAAQYYYCHQCDRTVTLPPSAVASGDISCPICCGGFLEEVDAPPPPSPSPSPNPFLSFPVDPLFFSSSPLSSFVFSSRSPAASFDIRHPNDLFGLIGSAASGAGSAAASPAPGPVPFDPMTFLQNHMQQLLTGGANIQIVVEGGSGGGGGIFGAGGLGDFVLGPGLEQIIQQLAENDPNRYGTPPAAKSAVASLPDIKITADLVASDEAQCAVCKDSFDIGDEAKQMPCKHIYHKDCILPWLELHNSCPVCRYELPTDDPDYEQRRGGATNPTVRTSVAAGSGNHGGAGGLAAGASGEGNSPGPTVVERRFRVSIPWPFRGFGAQGRGGNADGGGSTDASSGNQEDGHRNT